VFERREKSGYPVFSVGRAEYSPVDEGYSRQNQHNQAAYRNVGEEKDHKEQKYQSHGASEIGLTENQQSKDGKYNHRAYQNFEIVKFFPVPVEIIGEIENPDYLYEFNGLYHYGFCQENPASCAFHRRRNCRNQKNYEQQDGDGHNDRNDAAYCFYFSFQEYEENYACDEKPEHLLEKDKIRVAAFGGEVDGRYVKNHYKTENGKEISDYDEYFFCL